MSTTLIPVITNAGLQAVFTASNNGLQAEIIHIALGDAGYAPDKEATGLRSERVRIPIAEATRVGEAQIHLTGLLDSDVEFWVREIGFILADGTLLALWSNAEEPLAYKACGVDLLLSFDLALATLPAESVTVQGTSQIMSLDLTEELVQATDAFVRQATVQVRTMQRQVGLLEEMERPRRIENNAGQVAFFARIIPPVGWLKANGILVSRTAYPDLFAAIGTTFGTGDGSTTFGLPDLRGEFLRGFDDGRGVDAGRGFGTGQRGSQMAFDDGNQVIAPVQSAGTGQSPSVTWDLYDGNGTIAHGTGSGVSYLSNYYAGRANYFWHARPRNIALLACIKY